MNIRALFLPAFTLLLAACAGISHLQVETSRFPVPIVQKAPVRLGIHLDETLKGYVHKESIEKVGDFAIAIGPAQNTLFNNLALGIFEEYEFVDSTVASHLDGVLYPSIAEVQFSLPSQTRSDYYEIWIRYQFRLLDRAGNLVSEWSLPAYGKANQNDHGAKDVGLEEATLAACRDAMAFFSINFTRESAVKKWLAAGKPLVAQTATQRATQTAAKTPPAALPAVATTPGSAPANASASVDSSSVDNAAADSAAVEKPAQPGTTATEIPAEPSASDVGAQATTSDIDTAADTGRSAF